MFTNNVVQDECDSTALFSIVKDKYERAGQSHVLKHISNLPPSEKESFLKELDSIDVENLANLMESAKAEQVAVNETITTTAAPEPSKIIEPFNRTINSTKDKKFVKTCYEIGLEAIKAGNVCAIVLAGGQGTRLGFDGPKGMYPLLHDGKTLFQILAERIIKLQNIALGKDIGKVSTSIIPWYIMTSPMNHEETASFFEKHDFFGLKKENVTFFQQGVLPCVDNNGKMILETRSKCAMAPDGNGGIYISMKKNNVFKDMRRRNIKYVHTFAIDNALVKPADPTFIGCCIKDNADCGNKVLWKRDASEKVGVIALKNGKPCVIEYSDMDQQLLGKKDEKTGELVYGAANICNHFYTLDFLEQIVIPNLQGIYHIANKKIPYWDPQTEKTIVPTEKNGMKLESFIFDVFPLSSRMTILQVCRDEEFAPVKNAPGSSTDSPDQAREMMSNLAKSWVQQAGAVLKGDVESNSCEVSPLTSYSGEGLGDMFEQNRSELTCPFHI